MAKLLDNLSIRNKVVYGLLITLFISMGIGIVEFNNIVKIQQNFEGRKVFGDYKTNFLELQNLFYKMEVSVVKLANARSKEVLIKEQNTYKSIDLDIENILNGFDSQEFDIIKNPEQLFLLETFNDSIFKYSNIYREKIILSVKKLDEYVNLTFHPDQVSDNYQRLIAEQQSLGNTYNIDYQFMTQDEIVWELLSTYERAILDLEKFITSSLSSQEFSLDKITITIQEEIDKDNIRLLELRRSNIRVTIIVFVIGILFVLLVSYLISQSIVKPLFTTNNIIAKLERGDIPDKINAQRTDEIGVILESLDGLIEYLNNTTKFSKEIAVGNFSYHYNTAGETDVLGRSLIELKDSLVVAKREEKRREIEDARRRRTADGIAKFSDILRQNQNNLKKLGQEVISNLVKFIKANQGVLFTLVEEDEEVYLSLLSAYAWNREKFLEKQIKIGEGLIGSVAQEKFTVYMTDVPEDYIEIKSGTGSANPKSILIIPLKVEDEVLGVLEIASFQDFEQYEIQLVEIIAENIASTLKSVRITAQTSELLEKFQIQAAEMKEQEHAMKETIDDLRRSEEKKKLKEEELVRNLKEMSELNKQIQFKDEQLKNEIDRLSEENTKKIKQLDLQQKQSREILESMLTGVIIIKQGGSIEFVNKATEEIFGYNDMELLGIEIDKLIEMPPDVGDKKLCEFLFENLLKIKEAHGREFYIKLKNGQLKKILLELMVLESEKQEDMRMVIFIKDMERFEKQDIQNKTFVNKLIANDFENVMKFEFYEEIFKQNNISVPTFELNKEEIIKWGPHFELGVAMIDNQHKRWIHFINDLYKGLNDDKKSDDLAMVFKKLMDYTDYHFGFEEKYMNEFGYEQTQGHEISHEKFISGLNEMFLDYIEGRTDTAYNLILFLKKWVTEHVTVTDRKYVDLFKRHGIR
ncbi:MAG: bacteriohemerythrin [Bacteroidales bacterium]|nr:bacteriohemerythrin [Bacteroidales bacterium]